MSCEDVRASLGADADGELSPEEARAVADHLATCAECRRERDALMAVRGALGQQLPPLAAPDLLRARITSSIRSADATASPGPRRRSTWPRQVAAGLAIAIASSGATWLIVRQSPGGVELATSNVVESHIRSLMSNHLTEVTSTDAHNVKPWFDGKVPFAPNVPRLDSEGFPLIGGRVDSVGHDVAAALVYGRRKHLINVFAWMAGASGKVDTSDTGTTERGYHTLRWIRGDMQYAAVSDLATGELREFVQEFRARETVIAPEPH